MKFVCDRCQTKYSIADEKVRGKVLKVRCKTCSNVITVREPSVASASAKPSVPSLAPVREGPAGGAAAAHAPATRRAPTPVGSPARSPTQPVSASAVVGSAVAPARSPSASHAPVRAQAHAVSQARAHAEPASHPSPSGAYPATDLDELTEHTAIASVPAHFFAPTPPPLQRKAPRPPVAPAEPEGLPWFVALDGHQEGSGQSLPRLIERLLALPRGADVHVWNEKMDGWKEPQEVPELARELAARRRPAPPPPPLPPRHAGAAGRPTPPAPLAPMASGRSGAAPSLAAGPLSSAAPRLPRPSVRAATLGASAAAQALDIDLDPSTALETPGPKTHPVPGKANGAAAGRANERERSLTGRAAVPVAPLQGESDALNALNLGSRVGPAVGAHASGAAAVGGSAPRLVSADALAGLDAGAHVEPASARHRSAKLILGFLLLVAVVCVVLFVGVMKKPSPAAPVAGPAKAATGESDFGALAAKAAAEKAAAPAVAPPPVAPPPPAPAGRSVKTVGGGKPGKGPARGGKTPAPRGGATAAAPAGGPALSAADEAVAARFRDDTGRKVTAATSAAPRGGQVNQSDITRVINSNKNGIKACYQRALLRDSSLTHGKITVRLAVGISGRVKSVGVDGPTSFRVLEPCIKELVLRWMFPASGDSYETEFSYVFQGNE